MLYLSQMLGKPVMTSDGEELGKISDLAISTGEVFPHVTSFAFKGPANTPLMVSWRKFVDCFDGDQIKLNVIAHDVRFAYQQPNEVLLSRDLMNKQIVDTQGLKVVRVNDLKFSVTHNQLRLLGAEVGIRGILRGLSPIVETAVLKIAEAFKHPIQENIIAWSYMDLLERDLSQVKLSVSHKRLHELHPADVADILEQLDPQQRAAVFAHLDTQQAAETISELEDEFQSDVIDDLPDARASRLLAQMDPDDAADIIGDLPYEKAEKLLRLMGMNEAKAIRSLLGYKEKTAGGIMTTQFLAVPEGTTVGETIERLRNLPEDHEPVQYVYVTDENGKLTGVLSMRTLVLSSNAASVTDLAFRDIITVNPDEDQEDVAEGISKYSITAMPVVDEETGKLLGIVTFDDALEVMEEEHDEDLAIAGATQRGDAAGGPVIEFFSYFANRETWFYIWIIAACVAAFAGWFSQLAGALVLLPLILMIASDTTNYVLSALIDYDEGEEVNFMTLFGRDVLVGILIAGFSGIIVMGVVNIVSSQLGTMPDILETVQSTIPAAMLTVFIIIASSILLARFAKMRYDKGIIASNARASVVLMILAAVLFIALTMLGASVLPGLAL